MTPTPLSRRERILRIQETVIAHLEKAMQALHRQVTSADAPPEPPDPALMREAARRFGFWSLCGHRACFRAHRCRRKPGECIAACGPEVPPEVRVSVLERMKEAYR
jgi:beta-phosphoglucomutase-like phosphatase (HAD superfamily)